MAVVASGGMWLLVVASGGSWRLWWLVVAVVASGGM